MAKMYSLTKIIMPDPKTGEEILIPKNKVFDATPEQAKQFDALKSARQATNDEIAAAKDAEKIADGTAFVAPAPSDPVVDDAEPARETSGVSGDPKNIPKGKTV